MHRPIQVTHTSFIEGAHTTKNTASGPSAAKKNKTELQSKMRYFNQKSKFSKYHCHKRLMLKMRVKLIVPKNKFLTYCKLHVKIILRLDFQQNKMQSNFTLFFNKLFYSTGPRTGHLDTYHNDTHHNDIHHNIIQYNDTQHNKK